MATTINYDDTQFERANLTLIRGETTLETTHKYQNEVNANADYVYSNIGRVNNFHLGLVLTDENCELIYQDPFVWQNHSVLLTITVNTTAAIITVLHGTHTKDLHVLREVMGFDQALIQYIIDALKEAYLVDTRYQNTNTINMPISELLTQWNLLQVLCMEGHFKVNFVRLQTPSKIKILIKTKRQGKIKRA